MSVLVKKISKSLAVLAMLVSIFTINVKPAEVKGEDSFTISGRDYIGILGNFTDDRDITVVNGDYYDPNYDGPGFAIFGEHGYYPGKTSGDQPENLLSEKYGFQITNGDVNLVQTGFFIRKDTNTHRMYLENYDVADDDYYRWLNEVMSTGVLPKALFSFEITADLSATASFNVSSPIMQDDLTLYFVKINNYPFDYKLVLKNRDGETIKETQPIADSGHTTWPFIYVDVKKEITINKINSETKESLAGAVLAIYDANNVKLLQWTSDDQPKIIRLPEGEYMLVEESAPRGYKKADPKSFTVDYSTNNPISVIMEDVPEEPEPELQTAATDKRDNDKIINNRQATVIDTITYSNLDPESTYRIEGKLVTKSSNGENVVATNFIDNFKPVKATGEVSMEFVFDATNLDSQELVVFEYLSVNNDVVAKHEDINSTDQTVKVELPETVEVQVVKTWNDGDNKDNIRPNSITVLLLADSEEVDQVELNEENGWKHTFTDLPKLKNNKEIVYTVNEKDVPKNYELSVEGYILTNSLTFGGFQVIKTDQDNESVAGATLQIINDSGQNITLKDGRTVEHNGLIEEVTTGNDGIIRTSDIYPKYIDEVDFELAKYRIEEQTPPDGYYSENKILAKDLTISIQNGGFKEVQVKNKKFEYRSIRIRKEAFEAWEYKDPLIYSDKIPVPGAKISLVNAMDVPITDKNGKTYQPYEIITTLITDEKGRAKTEDVLPIYTKVNNEIVPVLYSFIETDVQEGFRYPYVYDHCYGACKDGSGSPLVSDRAVTIDKLFGNKIGNYDGVVLNPTRELDSDGDGIGNHLDIEMVNGKKIHSYKSENNRFSIVPLNNFTANDINTLREFGIEFEEIFHLNNVVDYGSYNVSKSYATYPDYHLEPVTLVFEALDGNDNPYNGEFDCMFIKHSPTSSREVEFDKIQFNNGLAKVSLPEIEKHNLYYSVLNFRIPKGHKIRLIKEESSDSKIYSVHEYSFTYDGTHISNDSYSWIENYYSPDAMRVHTNRFVDINNNDILSEFWCPDTEYGLSTNIISLVNIPKSSSVQIQVNAKKNLLGKELADNKFGFALKYNDNVIAKALNLKDDIDFIIPIDEINYVKKEVDDFTEEDWENVEFINSLMSNNSLDVASGNPIYIKKGTNPNVNSNDYNYELNDLDIFKLLIEVIRSRGQIYIGYKEIPGFYGFFYDDVREYTISEIIPEDVIDNIKDNIKYDPHEEKVIVRITGTYGYEPKIEIEYDSDGAVFTNVYHEPKTIKISKVDIAGKELENASIQILDVNKNIVDEWVSTKDIHEIQVQPGTYIFHEEIAPKGYQVVTDITFSVDEYGKVIVENTKATASDNMLVVTDDLLPPNKTQVLITKTNLGGVELLGAKITVRGEGFEETWTSTNVAHSLLLEPGNYELEELLPPDGFKQVKTVIKFEILETGDVKLITTAVENGVIELQENNKVLLKDAPLEFKVEISKQSINGTEELPGAELKVSGKNFLDEDVEVIWVSSNVTKKITLLPGSYTLTEIAPPENFQIAEAIDFTIDEEGNVISDFAVDGVIVMKDIPVEEEEQPSEEFEVVISKVELGQSEELTDAELRVIGTGADNSNFTVSWISGGEAKTLQLKPGTYTLIEDRAPLGFDIAESIDFEVAEDGSILVEGNEVPKLVMEDKPTTPIDPEEPVPEEFDVVISKVILGQDKELQGAHLSVKGTSSDGKEINISWISSTAARTIKLPTGEYTLTEDRAPLGYDIAESIEFAISESGEISVNGSKAAKLVMEDKQLEHTIKVSKINIAGEEIPGANIQIKDANSNLIHSWTSERNKTHEFKLLPGKYIFHEETAPNGYLTVNDIKFTVGLDGKISVKEVKGEVEYKNGVLVVTDKAKPSNPTTPTTPTPQPVKPDVKTGAGDFVLIATSACLVSIFLLLTVLRKKQLRKTL